MLLSAPTPTEWLTTHLAARFGLDEGSGTDGPSTDEPRGLSRAALLADGAAVLVDQHERLVASEGVPPAAAATYLAGWVVGLAAEAVGFGLATAAAGFVVAPETLRWRQHPDGWMDRVDLDAARVVVPAGHRWCGRAEVVTLGDAAEWNEVSDGLAMAVAFQPCLAVDEQAVEALTEAVATTGVPWRARPTLRIVDSASGPAYVAQKGGCCLAYTRPHDEPVVSDETDMDADQLAYRQRFPADPDTPLYCSTCTFRASVDCQARQLFWLERRRAEAAVAGAGPE